MAWYYIVLLVAYIGTILSLVGVVMSENRNPVKSLAWITVLLMVPVFGVVLYIFFGRSLKNTRMITRRNRRRLRRHESARCPDVGAMTLSRVSKQLIRMGQAVSGVSTYSGNLVRIFTDGPSKFASLLDDISKAESYILLQYYILDDDSTGRRLADALIESARRGVRVRVIYDHIGCMNTPREYFRRMEDAGIAVYPFFKVTFPIFATRINWRNHRKIVVVDGRIGYVGGMNIADRYMRTSADARGAWRDTHLRIVGPAVGGLQYSFAVDWSFMGQPLIEDKDDTRWEENPNECIQLHTSGPTGHWSNIAMLFAKAIGNASRRVYIQTPYFLPPEYLLRALQVAALAKVDVRIMMPERSDSAILTNASYSYVQECLRSGIKIYLYRGGMLHAKTVIIDDEISSVGSTNFDFRSFEHNFECNAFIYSREVNQRLADIFVADMRLCGRVNPGEWNRRPKLQKAKESIVRLLSPVL